MYSWHLGGTWSALRQYAEGNLKCPPDADTIPHDSDDHDRARGDGASRCTRKIAASSWQFRSSDGGRFWLTVSEVKPDLTGDEPALTLADLRSKMDGNEKLETMLEDVIQNADKQKELSDALGIDAKEE